MSRLWTIKQKHSVGGDFLRLICIIICLLGNKGFAQTAWDGTIASKFGGVMERRNPRHIKSKLLSN